MPGFRRYSNLRSDHSIARVSCGILPEHRARTGWTRGCPAGRGCGWNERGLRIKCGSRTFQTTVTVLHWALYIEEVRVCSSRYSINQRTNKFLIWNGVHGSPSRLFRHESFVSEGGSIYTMIKMISTRSVHQEMSLYQLVISQLNYQYSWKRLYCNISTTSDLKLLICNAMQQKFCARLGWDSWMPHFQDRSRSLYMQYLTSDIHKHWTMNKLYYTCDQSSLSRVLGTVHTGESSHVFVLSLSISISHNLFHTIQGKTVVLESNPLPVSNSFDSIF